MKAWVVKNQAHLGLEQLRLLDVPIPKPQVAELQVKVQAVGLNPVDYKIIDSGVAAWQYPHTIGIDVAGEVSAVGPDVTDFKLGDRVFYHSDLRRNGALATYNVTLAASVAKLPDALSYVQGAAILCANLTAYQALIRKVNLTNAQTVLIHAGGGAVGLAALQLAKQLGLRTITTVSARKRALVEKVGADTIIDYHQEDVTAAVLKATEGRGVDVSLNTIGGSELAADAARMAYNGQIVAIGDGMPQHFDFDDHALALIRSGLGGVYRSNDPVQIHDLAVMAQAVAKLVVAAKLDPLIGDVQPFDQVPTALQTIKSGRNVGKLVIQVTA
ncbi:zinc-binding dehydrogenase [Lactiplantibacillus sp. WILCCON 0030]|uniref:Zinc-binding dehydrogenase n=1 Tax=Lactiplantibacillus brownii TaxID=3069269 RepID=A0ABU1ACY9_9LACO|nr:zinc-binding dehydrogenase [Lactiplantibacillus brownii]MDQ7938180.1 zinc-binding dehydrogenase [Lactiplantibacillus brownii]